MHSLYQYPLHMRFFSTPELLEIGGVPFVTQNYKPNRLEALEYYRKVAESLRLDVRLYEKVTDVEGETGDFHLTTTQGEYRAAAVIVAIGFFDRPRLMHVPGEELPKVQHYYREPHPYTNQDVLVVGSGNSAAQVALECYRHGARVAVAVRSKTFHQGVKYWIRPDIDNRIKTGEITGYFETQVVEIKENEVTLEGKDGSRFAIPNDFVLAMTGYEPDFDFLRKIQLQLEDDEHLTPVYDPETYESSRPGVYLAGVVVGGMCTNKWFIENSRVHAEIVFDDIVKKI